MLLHLLASLQPTLQTLALNYLIWPGSQSSFQLVYRGLMRMKLVVFQSSYLQSQLFDHWHR
ncbi:hypothetical protein [Escherichia phage PH1062]|nr:hypothetical protein [Escherichia phage PH1062]